MRIFLQNLIKNDLCNCFVLIMLNLKLRIEELYDPIILSIQSISKNNHQYKKRVKKQQPKKIIFRLYYNIVGYYILFLYLCKVIISSDPTKSVSN